MKQTYKVFYDGELLRPWEPVALEANKEYSVTIEEIILEEKARPTNEEAHRAQRCFTGTHYP